jgi:hypothetical protein
MNKCRLASLLCLSALTALLAPTTDAAAVSEPDARARLERLEKKQADLLRMEQEIQSEMQELRKELGVQPAAAGAGAPVSGAPASGQKVEEVERKQDVITEEVRKIKEALVLPETEELKSQYGLGPGASKVYNVTRGVSLGSYGEWVYRNTTSDDDGQGDQFDMLRLVLYTGYKFNDWLLFNSEVEFEHGLTGEDGGGEVHVEFATIDALLDPKINLRGGLVLVPMGFLNEMHEPPFFHGNLRPQVETQILPSTWDAGGAGVFGQLLPGLTYRSYAVTGFDATGFTSEGLREGRQEGSLENAKNWAWVGRVDYSPLEMLTLGGSAYVGDSGQGQLYGNAVDGFTKADVFTQIYEGHAQLRTHGLEARLLAAWSSIDDAGVLSRDASINPHVLDPTKPDQPVASEQFGWYGELAYDVLPLVMPGTGHYLAPWFRYSHVDTQMNVPAGFTADDLYDFDVFEVGIDYKPIPQVVFKLDYRNQDPKSGSLPDEVHIGAGFVY